MNDVVPFVLFFFMRKGVLAKMGERVHQARAHRPQILPTAPDTVDTPQVFEVKIKDIWWLFPAERDERFPFGGGVVANE